MDSASSINDLLSVNAKQGPSAVLALSSQLVSRGIMYPKIIFERATSLVLSRGNSSVDDKWTLLEKIVLSAIKLDNEQWVGYGLNILRTKFPNSDRVERLVALYREAKEDWIEAESVYKGMLSKSPDNMYARKRLIACLKAQGRTKDCINSLIDQLEIFSADGELWHELSMQYMTQVAFSRACASFDEVVLMDPRSFYNLLVYAELLASNSDWTLARKYYCKALEYRPTEVRALWGLLTCLVEGSSRKVDAKEAKVVAQLADGVKSRLSAVYSPIDTASAKLALKLIQRSIVVPVGK